MLLEDDMAVTDVAYPFEMSLAAISKHLTVLAEAGCVAFSQGDVPLVDTLLMWRALQYAATFKYPVWLRPQDSFLAKNGVAHDGEVATRLGLPGIPTIAETIPGFTVGTW